MFISKIQVEVFIEKNARKCVLRRNPVVRDFRINSVFNGMTLTSVCEKYRPLSQTFIYNNATQTTLVINIKICKTNAGII